MDFGPQSLAQVGRGVVGWATARSMLGCAAVVSPWAADLMIVLVMTIENVSLNGLSRVANVEKLGGSLWLR